MIRATLIIILLCIVEFQATAQAFRNFNVEEGLNTNRLHEVFQDSKGLVWIGTENGVVRFDGNEFEHYSDGDGLAGRMIININEDSYGNIWFGSLYNELSYYSYSEDTIKSYHLNDEIEQSGEYKIEIQAANAEGTWGPLTIVEFSVEQLLWKRPWFIWVSVFVLICSIVLYARVKLRRTRLELEQKNAFLTAQSQTLASQLNPHFLFNSMNSVSSFMLLVGVCAWLEFVMVYPRPSNENVTG